MYAFLTCTQRQHQLLEKVASAQAVWKYTKDNNKGNQLETTGWLWLHNI